MNWARALLITAVLDLGLLLGIGLALGDREALAFAAIVGACTVWLLFRRSLAAVVVRGLVFADVEAFMAPGAISNLAHAESLGAVLAPLLLAVVSAGGILATLGFIVTRRRQTSAGVNLPVTAIAGIAALVVGAGSALAAASPSGASGDLGITIKNAHYSSTELRAAAGRIAIDVANDDLFWHTLTFDDMPAEVRVPVKARRQLVLQLAAGVYKFHCAIPGHAAIGMRGTLTVR